MEPASTQSLKDEGLSDFVCVCVCVKKKPWAGTLEGGSLEQGYLGVAMSAEE